MYQYTAPRRVYCTPSKVQKRVFLLLHVVWHSKAPRHPIWRGDLGSLLDPFQWLHSALPDLLLSLPLRPPPPTKPFRPLSVSHIMFRRQSKSSQVYSERREGFLFFHEKNSQIPHQKVSNYAHKTATPPSPFFLFSSAFSDSANLHEHVQSFRRTDPASQSFSPFRPAAAPRRKMDWCPILLRH